MDPRVGGTAGEEQQQARTDQPDALGPASDALFGGSANGSGSLDEGNGGGNSGDDNVHGLNTVHRCCTAATSYQIDHDIKRSIDTSAPHRVRQLSVNMHTDMNSADCLRNVFAGRGADSGVASPV